MHPVRQSALCSLLLVPAALTAQADSTRAGVVLPTIVVTGVPLPTPLAALGFSVTALRLDRQRYGPAPDATRTLLDLAGTAMEEGAGVNGPTNVSLRGADEQYTQLLMDGLPLNISGGFMDTQGLTLVNVERVEVARGPQSVLYGSAAVAGAVQFITRRGRAGPFRASVAAEGGSAVRHGNQTRFEVLADGGTTDVRVSAGLGLAYDRGIYRLPHDLRSHEGSLRLDIAPASAVTVTATARYADIASNLPVRDAGVTRAPLDPNQRDRRDRTLLGLVTRFQALPGWTQTLTLGAAWDDATYADQFDDVTGMMAYPFFIADFDLTVRSVLRRLTAGYDGVLTTGPATWAYGTRIEQEEVRNDQTGQFGDAVSTFTRAQRAAYAELAVGSATLHGRAGIRVEGTDDLGTALTPRVGLAVQLTDRLALRAAAGRAFKVPNIQQQYFTSPNHLPNPDLRPETSWTVEGGVEGMPTNRLAIGVTVYHQWYEDIIRTVPVDSVNRSNRNIGASRAWGVEVSAHGPLSSAVTWSVTGARMLTRLEDNSGLAPDLYPVGAPLPGLPTGTARVTLDGTRGRVGGGLGLRVVGPRPVLTERFDGSRVTLDAYGVLDAYVAVEIHRAVSAYIRADNLLDAGHAVAFDRPGRPLTIVVGMRAGR